MGNSASTKIINSSTIYDFINNAKSDTMKVVVFGVNK